MTEFTFFARKENRWGDNIMALWVTSISVPTWTIWNSHAIPQGNYFLLVA